MGSSEQPPAGAGAEARELIARARQLDDSVQGFLRNWRATEERASAAVLALAAQRTPRRTLSESTYQINFIPNDGPAQDALAALRCAERVQQAMGAQAKLAQRVADELSEPLTDAAKAAGRLRFMFSGGAKRDRARGALAFLHQYVKAAEHQRLGEALDAARAQLHPSPREVAGAWDDLGIRPRWYHSRIATALEADPARGGVLPAREVRRAMKLLRLATPLAQETERARKEVLPAFEALRKEMVRRDLARMPLAKVKEVTTGHLRVNLLETAGFLTILSVLEANVWRLQSINGVGHQTAMQVHAAARQLATAAEEDLSFRINLDPEDALSTRLVVALHRWGQLHRALSGLQDNIEQLVQDLAPLSSASPPQQGWVGFFAGTATATSFDASLIEKWLAQADTQDLWSRLQAANAIARRGAVAGLDAWEDFKRRSADYYTLLGLLVDLKTDLAASEGYLPEEVVARVHQQPLDLTFARVSLRGYQSFGARFALVQERVILGDEMGLGKTIEAIAALAHLKASGRTHFLVVCPASVLINWMREIRERSRLVAYQLHGLELVPQQRRWLARGDVAVTTFGSLKHLDVPANLDIGLLIVDEAHYVKNPNAQRSRKVSDLATRAERVLFLTGTPMENRVEEFINLIDCLQPDMDPQIDARRMVLGATAFRKAVAPVYLRRNQEDVLTELPELVQVDEWETFSSEEFAAYRQAVADGNFMAMRRAAFSGGDPTSSPKLNRLLEIVDEAGENGHKVIVFSYFRDVLDVVHRALGRRAFGPLTGSVAANQRQLLVDAFARADGRAVLVSQIQAGGVGLNMQSASVVILCEPQVKPTMEAQAIARAHRMGQLQTVQVHRLLTQDSVDQRMLEILDNKQRLFDEYARKSDVAGISPEAVDISEATLARQVITAEQERLAMSAMEPVPGMDTTA